MSISTSSRLNAQSTAELLNSGYTEDSLVRLPHYTAPAHELTEVLGFPVSCSGLAFVYQDVDGSPMLQTNGKPFIRVKLHRNPQEVEYFESSTGRKNGKYSSPKGAGCRFYFSPLLKLTWEKARKDVSKALYLVEGEKKADVACQEGFNAIGLGGVYSWKEKTGDTSSPIADFGKVEWKYRQVYLCPDSDVTDPNKPMIKQAMKELAIHLESLGAKVNLIVLPNALDKSKMGADDFISRYGKDRFATFARFSVRALKNVGNSKKNPTFELDFSPPDNSRQAEVVSWLLSDDYAVRPGNGFYKFSDTHWKPLHEKQTVRFLQEAYDSQNWRLNSLSSLTFAEKVVSSLLLVPELRWNTGFNILFSNGTFNPSLKLFSPTFDKSSYGTIEPLAFPYQNITAKPERFLQFLEEITGGDVATIELLQAIIRYVWIPKDRTKVFPIQAAFDFYGGKGTGKSTFLELIMQGLGKDACASADPSVFSTPERLSALLDKRAAISTDCSGHLDKVGNFNAVVSNEAVQVRTLYNQPVFTRLGIVVLRAYNKFISVASGGTQGLDRRVLAIEFNIAPKVVDNDLPNKLARELPAIFQWSFGIGDEEMVRRIETRNSSRLAMTASIDRFVDNNPIYQFLLEQYQEEGTSQISVKDIYPQYVAWCELQHMHPVKQKNFLTSVLEYGCSYVLKADGTPKTQARYNFIRVPAMKEFNIKAHLGIADMEETPAKKGSKEGETENQSDSLPPATELSQTIEDAKGIGFVAAQLESGEYMLSRDNYTGHLKLRFPTLEALREEIARRQYQQSPAGLAEVKQQIIAQIQRDADAGNLVAQMCLDDFADGSDTILDADIRVLEILNLF